MTAERVSSNDAYIWFPPIGWSEAKWRRVLRSLYGIVRFEEQAKYSLNRLGRGPFYDHYNVPAKHFRALETAFRNDGKFPVIFREDDVQVLRAVYERRQYLRERYGTDWNPRFYVSEIAGRCEIKKKAAVERLERLEGVLARATVMEHKWSIFRETAFTKDAYDPVIAPVWFLPSARIKDAEAILRQFDRSV